MLQALVIKTDMLLRDETLKHYQRIFAEQLKTGVVLIPAYFNAELVNVPDDVEVIVESSANESFLDKELHVKGE